MPHTPATNPVWVRYEAKSSLANLTALSPFAELAHRRLADTVWSTGRWPLAHAASTRTTARIPIRAWPKILRELREVGWHTHRQRLVNHAVGRILTEARAAQAIRSDKCKNAAEARWQRAEAASPTPQTPPLPLPPGPPPAPAAPSNAPGIAPCIAPSSAQAMPVHNSNSTVHNTVNDAERLTRSVSPRKASAKAEQDFISDVEAAMKRFSPSFAGTELTNWGGWWRNRFRENPDKARRILAEITSMVNERRILVNPGAAASDLWSRLP